VGAKTNVAGASSYPQARDPPISVVGSITTPSHTHVSVLASQRRRVLHDEHVQLHERAVRDLGAVTWHDAPSLAIIHSCDAAQHANVAQVTTRSGAVDRFELRIAGVRA
jgi:hypothetical protein